MVLINRLLIAFIFIGLLAVAFFAFGENGPLHEHRLDTEETLFQIAEEEVYKIPASALENNVYTIDAKKSELAVRLFKAGIASAFAHDHIVRAEDFSGWVAFEEDRPDLFKLAAEVPVDSLVADSREDREKYKLSELDDDDRKEINETMKGSTQLHGEKYPRIRFRSSRLQKTDTNSYTINGKFTLHGTTKTVTVPATITTTKDGLHIKGEFRFLQSDYGIEPYSAGLGTIRNKDEVLLLFDLYATEKN